MTRLSFMSLIGGHQREAVAVRPSYTVASPAARALALAHYIEKAVESGAYGSAADLARALGVTRARVSQITLLLHLAPQMQEEILCCEDTRSTRSLRPICGQASWASQKIGGSLGTNQALSQ